MVSFPARVTRASTRGATGYIIRLTGEQADALPSGGARFVVRLSDPENPKRVLVPTMETQVKRFGVDRAMVVPGALIVGGVLRARHDVLVTLVPQSM